jgi:predicted nucleic acid-binding protein
MISTFTAVFDSNVLFGARLRSFFMELAMTGLFRARWSEDIHREWMTSVSEARGIPIERLQTTRECMNTAVPDGSVTGYADLMAALTLPDPNDRHVLAAAIRCGASAIVTFNLDDFPLSELSKFGLHTVHPDHFVRDVDFLDPGVVSETARTDWLHYQNPPLSIDDYIEGIKKAGLPMTAAHLNLVRVLFTN